MGKRYLRKDNKLWLGLGLGAVAGYALAQQGWALWQILNKNVERTLNTQTNEAPKGIAFSETTETKAYTRSHVVEDGIERIAYVPKNRRFETAIVMQHGMWHGAWCWQLWQELFAEWGWETHAHSLPGHAAEARRSRQRRPVPRRPQRCRAAG